MTTLHEPVAPPQPVVSVRVAQLLAAVAVAAALHLAAAPSHFPERLPLAASAHPGHRHSVPGQPTTATAADPLTATERRDANLLGLGFVLSALWGLGCCWWLLTRPLTTSAALVVAGSHALMLAAGVVSRTVGLLGHRDPWGETAFLLAITAEAIVVVLLWPVVQPRRGSVDASTTSDRLTP